MPTCQTRKASTLSPRAVPTFRSRSPAICLPLPHAPPYVFSHSGRSVPPACIRGPSAPKALARSRLDRLRVATSRRTFRSVETAHGCYRAPENPRASSRPPAVAVPQCPSTSFRMPQPELEGSGHKPYNPRNKEQGRTSQALQSLAPTHPASPSAPHPAPRLLESLRSLPSRWSFPPFLGGQRPIASPAPGMRFLAQIESRGCLLRD